MRSTTLSATAVILSALNLVSGQTFTDCNPLSNSSCPSDPALGKTITTDFTLGASSDWSLADGTTLSYGTNGAEFTISKSTNAPTISSEKYIFFGKVSVVTKASPGTGIVSSFILESDDLDEIDWEWLGSTDSSVESNFFGKGDTSTYDRAVYHNVATPIETWHTYTIDWTSSSVQWIIDGTTVRTLLYGDALAHQGKNYPQTPMRVKMGSWVGCASVAAETATATAGTCSWAGGAADFTKGPFTMYVKSVTVEDYGCGTEYTYGDTTGSFSSIKSSGSCNGTTNSASSATVSSSTSASAKSTSSAGIFAETSTTSTSATGTATGTATGATTLTTATAAKSSSPSSSQSAGSSSSSTTSSPAAKATTSDATKPKHQYGILDFTVIALGLGVGYLVM